MRLPAVVSKLYKAINSNGGVTYIHCTAGLGRAPAVAVCPLILFVTCLLLVEYLTWNGVLVSSVYGKGNSFMFKELNTQRAGGECIH